MIRLTYDDGPDPEWTPLVLDALARGGARATFFPLSPRVVAYPELIARIADEGHALGLHGWGHLRHPDHNRATVAADTERALAVFPRPPTLWRFPYGEAAAWSADLAAEHGLEVVHWTHDSGDWRGDDAATMRAALGDLADDALVLLHDALGPGLRRPDCAQTVRLTELLLLPQSRSSRSSAASVFPSSSSSTAR